MSLEAALQEHTQVMRELLARLTGGAIVAADAVKAEDTPVRRKDADKPAEKKAAEVPTIDYEKQVRPLLVKVSTTAGRDALVKLLDDFGVTKGDQLKPAQFPDVMAAADKVLESAEV